eukprot:1822301-Rhodomonas_salina.1
MNYPHPESHAMGILSTTTDFLTHSSLMHHYSAYICFNLHTTHRLGGYPGTVASSFHRRSLVQRVREWRLSYRAAASGTTTSLYCWARGNLKQRRRRSN